MASLIAIVLVSMSISALCSLLEACLLSMSHSDIAEMASEKPGMAAIWKRFKGNIQKPIAVILIINTIAHTTGASLSGAQFDGLFGPRWIVLFSFIFSFAMIQWTEILPKTIGVKYNRRIANLSTYPLHFLIVLFTPFIRLIELLNRPFVGKADERERSDTIREISVLSRFAFINNLISRDQERIISRTIGLTKKKAADIMIPRREMKFLHDGMTMMEALVEAHIHNHTRYPLVCRSRNDEITGYINFKDIVSALQINPENPSLGGIARPIMAFREDDDFAVLFQKFTRSHQHIAIVKNGNGDVTGLVTFEDVIEEIVGEIEDEYDELPSYLYPITKTRHIAGGGVTAGRVADALSVGMDNPGLTMHDWIVRRYGADQKPGNRYECDDIVIIVKKIRRTKISEVIVEKKQ